MRSKAASRLRTWISTSKHSPPKLLLRATCRFSFLFYPVPCVFFCFYSWLEGTRSRRQTPECAICYLKMAEVSLSARRYGRSIKERERQKRIGAYFNCFRFRSRRISLLCSLTSTQRQTDGGKRGTTVYWKFTSCRIKQHCSSTRPSVVLLSQPASLSFLRL